MPQPDPLTIPIYLSIDDWNIALGELEKSGYKLSDQNQPEYAIRIHQICDSIIYQLGWK